MTFHKKESQKFTSSQEDRAKSTIPTISGCDGAWYYFILGSVMSLVLIMASTANRNPSLKAAKNASAEYIVV